jgi:hypothetical protein
MRYIQMFCIALFAMNNMPSYSQDVNKRVCFEFYDNVFNLQFENRSSSICQNGYQNSPLSYFTRK